MACESLLEEVLRDLSSIEDLRTELKTLTSRKITLLQNKPELKSSVREKSELSRLQDLKQVLTQVIANLKHEVKMLTEGIGPHGKEYLDYEIQSHDEEKKPSRLQDFMSLFRRLQFPENSLKHFTRSDRSAHASCLSDGDGKKDEYVRKNMQRKKEAVENIEDTEGVEQIEKKEHDKETKLPTYRCPTSCGRDNFLGLLNDICARRALLDINVRMVLKLVRDSLSEKGLWKNEFDVFFDGVWVMCRRLRCCDFLPMAEKMGFINVVLERNINEPKKKSFSEALKEGQAYLKTDGLLVLVYKADDGTEITHCVQMLFCPGSEGEKNLQFFDCQCEKSKELGDFRVSCLLRIQFVEITKYKKNLQQDCGTYLCKGESGKKLPVLTPLGELMRRLPRKRRASV